MYNIFLYIVVYYLCNVGRTSTQHFKEDLLVCYDTLVVLFSIRAVSRAKVVRSL